VLSEHHPTAVGGGQTVRRPAEGYPQPVSSTDWHVAQVNIALPRAPLDDPGLEDFVSRLEPINALADASPGFVWRLQGETGDATGIRAFGDDRILVNLSVWETIEALGAFVFSSPHTEALRRRRDWFEQMVEAHLALWWIPAGATPTVEEAERRLATLRERGPSSDAFTLREPSPAPGSNVPVSSQDRWRYPTSAQPA
jgi:hypothetical protein